MERYWDLFLRMSTTKSYWKILAQSLFIKRKIDSRESKRVFSCRFRPQMPGNVVIVRCLYIITTVVQELLINLTRNLKMRLNYFKGPL